MDIALGLGADYVATGHYCRKGSFVDASGKPIYQLLAGIDANKDQSYFLCQLSQKQLAKTLFPIGALTKPEVREIAAVQNLITADKKDSQGLCFIGKVRLPEFLQQKLKPKTGDIVEIPSDLVSYHTPTPEFHNTEDALRHRAEKPVYLPADGQIVGQHQGAHYFTNGQRKGLNVGGTKEPLFVIATDVHRNIIYTGQGKGHPGLYRSTLFVKMAEMHWVREDLALEIGGKMDVLARIRYRQPLQKATLYQVDGGCYVDFREPQTAITEGQFVAWYLKDELLGSGVIS